VIVVVLALALSLQPAARPEVITAIQVHGNTVTSDDDVKRAAGIEAGSPFQPDTIETVTARLQKAKQFQSVQVLKRFASIDDPTQILVVIVVNEGPVEIDRDTGQTRAIRVVRSRGRHVMFLPILDAEDGYGLTYGVRFAWPDLLGAHSRVSTPLSWGGDKRAGVEFEKLLESNVIDRITAGASWSRRTNPFYEQDDTRERVWIRGERNVVKWVRAGTTVGWQRVTFPVSAANLPSGDADHFGHVGADIVFDTRNDSVLPRNAVYARAAWEHVAGANRVDLDARGFIGLIGQSVLEVRALDSQSDRVLPPYLKPLLGGMDSLRGFRAGTRAADSLVAASAEVIVPLTSPLSFGRAGVSGFVDVGTAYDYGARLADQTWRQGIGGSVWFSAAFLRFNVAVAHGINATTRVHVGANVTF